MIEPKNIAKQVLLMPSLYQSEPSATPDEQVFTEIYRKNAWNGTDSVSGTGSDTVQTRVIIETLPELCRELGVSTMLDIPCGDFNWMRHVDLSGVDYLGADIVDCLVTNNTERYGTERRRFQKLNLIKDRLPKADLVFCRDCLVHLSFQDLDLALQNICDSGSTYLLTTTFPERTENEDIPTGSWRVLNFERAPLLLPKPLKVINEGCTEHGRAYADKSLGLWRIADVRKTLTERR